MHPLNVHEWKSHAWFVGGALAYVLLFLFFYPSFFASTDEQSYAQGAYLVLEKQNIVVSDNHLYCGMGPLQDGGFATTYPIGKSLALVPFIGILGLHGGFLLGLLSHLLNFLLIGLILRRQNIPKEWALAYLVFPAFQWGSRTFNPEIHVLTAFLGAYYLLSSKWRGSVFAAGIILGVGAFFRIDAILGIIAFAAYLFLDRDPRVRSHVVHLLAGAAIPVLALITFNHMVYSSWLPRSFSSITYILGTTTLSDPLPVILQMLTFPILIFIVLPFSLWAAHTHRDRVLFLVLAVISFIFFTRFYSFWALETSLAHVFTTRLRYFIPLLGLLMIPTFVFYERVRLRLAFRAKSWGKYVLPVLFVLGILFTGIVQAQHASFLDSRAETMDAILAHTPNGATILGKPDMCTYFITSSSRSNFFYSLKEAIPDPSTLNAPIFLVDALLESQVGDSNRQAVVNKENALVKEFYDTHAGELNLIYESTGKNSVTIWEWTP